DDLASARGGHARAVTVTTLAYKLARLIGPLHDRILRWSRRGRLAFRTPKPPKARTSSGPAHEFARLIREGWRAVNAMRPWLSVAPGRSITPAVTSRHKPVRAARPPADSVYIAEMSGASPSGSGVWRRLLPLAVVVAAAIAVYWVAGPRAISLEALIRHRAEIDAFVGRHAVAAILAYTGIYIVAVSLSVPGATFLTVTSGFLFGVWLGAAASVVGATVGATVIFLVARTAFGEPLLARAGPRLAELARGFRDDAFSYLLFLRLVPAFPFFLVNLVPAFAGVRLGPFIAATALGVIPAAVAFALAGTGLDSVITAQKDTYYQCVASGSHSCRMAFDAGDVLTPRMVIALVALGLLALAPVVVKHLRARSRTTT